MQRNRTEMHLLMPEIPARDMLKTRSHPMKERIPQVPAKTQTETTENSKPGKELVNKNGEITKLTEWATVDANSIEDLIELFGEAGVSYSTGEEVTGDYRVIPGDAKQLWAKAFTGKRTFVVRWQFHTPDNGNEFVTMHLFIDGAGKFIVNDGAKSGMYGQLSRITSERVRQGQPEDRAHAGLLAERGIIQNKPFQFDKRTGKAIRKGDDVPAEFRGDSHPTWKFDL